MELKTPERLVTSTCYHCGDDCPKDHPYKEEKHFCCQGCFVVYNLLSENGMEEFYQYEDRPGISKKKKNQKTYEYLDEPIVIEKLLEFNEGNLSKLTLSLPQIHCSSCIWLLENIQKLNEGVVHSRVNFLQKRASITFRNDKISLRELVQLLSTIGYEPQLNLDQLHDEKSSKIDRSLFYKIGLAGFAFGNIMLLSFPEYLGFVEEDFSKYIGYINILLVLPVVLYSGFDYLRAAYWTISMRKITIDIPIAVGIVALFGRSVFDILTGAGEGYLDSLAGFIFFMLIGKWFQNYTFDSISFERNYKSYFPISAMVKKDQQWKAISLDALATGDTIIVKNEEIVPTDATIVSGEAHLDYSFVTGESELIHKNVGEKIFAGAKHVGSTIQVKALSKVDQSYLTSLWDENSFQSDQKMSSQKVIAQIGKYFTIITMAIALLTLSYWLWVDPSKAFNSFTAVLIVACPCALSLATPFTYGNVLRLLGNNHCYLKNVDIIENIQNVNCVVFDKTGTITDHNKMEINWVGPLLSTEEKKWIKSTVFQSNHPLSKSIFGSIEGPFEDTVQNFEETIGEGIVALTNNQVVKIGSEYFIFEQLNSGRKKGVFIQINGQFLGYYAIQDHIREGVPPLFNALDKKMDISILSGDNDREHQRLIELFPMVKNMYFNQSPKDKLDHIKSLQSSGKKVMMIGDGLNDAGALQQSNVGLVISNDANNFTPACDGILNATGFQLLLPILNFIRNAKKIIIGAFILALMYNIIGLTFAVQALLSPVIAAILMPVSSITVMLYGVLSSTLLYRYHLKR
ncbi:MAG: heavy metal translocating P-type ATPase metal-binding domain-containing protein [Saprospiraceae bacterium]